MKVSSVRKSASERIRVTLEEEIYLGALPPGHHLDEQKEAARFGVSRTPVREALHYLANAGLVTMSARRGAMVASFSVPQIIEMLEVLAELEALSARLAAQNMTDKELKELAQIDERCAKLVAKHEVDKYYHLGKELHERMYMGTRNQYLADSARALRNRVLRYLRHQLHSAGRAETCLEEQNLLVKALLARDSNKAAEAARDHVKVQQQVFSEFMMALERTGITRANLNLAPAQLAELWGDAK
ncbi:GntR family transcriptional regulator [Bradyrhizobium sp.]|uniref:GntR family transcriptional regulator n=1 Tax=Bradyrhizobium sp. TaxID=376 RepID=UPI0039E28D88